MTRTVRLSTIAAILIAGSIGCVSAEAKKEVAMAAAVGSNTLDHWNEATDVEKYQLYWASVRVHADLDYSLNGSAVPARFVGKKASEQFPPAIVSTAAVSTATAAPVGSR